MSKTYTAPTLITDDVVRETRLGQNQKIGEPTFKRVSASSTGFYL